MAGPSFFLPQLSDADLHAQVVNGSRVDGDLEARAVQPEPDQAIGVKGDAERAEPGSIAHYLARYSARWRLARLHGRRSRKTGRMATRSPVTSRKAIAALHASSSS